MGIEPTSTAWKAEVLPLNYTRRPHAENGRLPAPTASNAILLRLQATVSLAPASYFPNMVEGGGFEPPKAEPSDLQSDPFGHSGTPPALQAGHCASFAG